ncbi:protein OCTOPUS [Juglans microcarpa x Juglans regia]|uniref:protein OCTOPUS n=1 Tax=Juglans microcarpa x Juglans regia TaxID=2249226 RepID=UPI001B7E5F63|nr:protein OCTOPUS [Juglans microcarpa x Juglans regia]
MNPNTTEAAAASAALPPLPPQPHRPSTSCDRHPDEHFTGFCPSCLCERLAVLDPNSSSSASSSRKPPTSSTAAALKAIFKPSGGGGGPSSSANRNRNGTATSASSSFFPELRRTKSFSASKNEGFSGVFEPQRKSCDVRVRNTLWSLFTLDDERNPYKKKDQQVPSTSAWAAPDIEVDPRHSLLASSSIQQGPIVLFESKEEDEDEDEEDNDSEEDQYEDEIRVSQETNIPNVATVEERVQEIVEEEEEEPEPEPEPEPEAEAELEEEQKTEELKTMKDHIDLDSQTKKPSGRDFKEIAGSFWSAASVFSKKLQQWRQKQKLKKRRNGGGSATLPVEKPIGRQFRETQSEIADYGFGRRSCDTDPRFSLDAGRISFDASRISLDDPRCSFDEARASWDGYLIGRTFPRMPPMLSVVEDAPVHVLRSDTQIPVEEPAMDAIDEDETALPGGSAQTRDYYSDSSSRRRRSLDRSSSIRKTAAAVVAEIDELKSVSNAKVSPATTTDYFLPGPKLVAPDRVLRDSNSNSLRDDCSETFEMGLRDTASVVGNGERKGSSKKSKRWSKAWNIWGFIHRRGGNKDEDEDNGYARANGVERSLSESWPELRGERNGEGRGAFNPKVFRSNSSVSWRNSHNFGGSFGSARKNGLEGSGSGKKKRDDQFVLERNRSARYSPTNIDNGLLRFYLTPMRSSWRSGLGKSRSNHAHSITRSVLRLY